MSGLLTFVAWLIITCVMMEKQEDQSALHWMAAGMLAWFPTGLVGIFLKLIIG